MVTPHNDSVIAVGIEDDRKWHKIINRDRAADGEFWYSVNTTGVFCRPSCPSRLPSIKNVAFHRSMEDARASGFRACKRCLPEGPAKRDEIASIVIDACRMMEQSDRSLSLLELADAARLSASYFHRIFKKALGLTPKAYAVAVRSKRVRRELESGHTVTEALYDAGFNSNGRFYEKSTEMLGMTPSSYRAGAPNETIRYVVERCELGMILVASSERAVAVVKVGDDGSSLVDELRQRFRHARLTGSDVSYRSVVTRAVGLIERPDPELPLPLEIRESVFEHKVWQALRALLVRKTDNQDTMRVDMEKPRLQRGIVRSSSSVAPRKQGRVSIERGGRVPPQRPANGATIAIPK